MLREDIGEEQESDSEQPASKIIRYFRKRRTRLKFSQIASAVKAWASHAFTPLICNHFYKILSVYFEKVNNQTKLYKPLIFHSFISIIFILDVFLGTPFYEMI